MKSEALIKANIRELLKARKLHQQDLARWLRHTPEWLSQIMTKDDRVIPQKHWDRIADFFGLETYQLLQPGLAGTAERRRGGDRRQRPDRRVGRTKDSVKRALAMSVDRMDAADIALLLRIKSYGDAGGEVTRQVLSALESSARGNALPKRRRLPAGSASDREPRQDGTTDDERGE